MFERWQSAVDRAIEEALRSTPLDSLPGAGKPLKLDHDPYTPDENRLAYKILRENDLAPDWIMQARDLDAQQQRITQQLEQAARTYRRAAADAERAAPHMAAAYRQNAEDVWTSARRRLAALVEEYNRQVVSYNLKTPRGVAHRAYFNLEGETQRCLAGS